MPMPMHTKRAAAPITWKRGCMRSIRPDRARDDDLHFFLRMSKISRRVTARDLDELIRPV
jgi:hypothetical protein